MKGSPKMDRLREMREARVAKPQRKAAPKVTVPDKKPRKGAKP